MKGSGEETADFIATEVPDLQPKPKDADLQAEVIEADEPCQRRILRAEQGRWRAMGKPQVSSS